MKAGGPLNPIKVFFMFLRWKPFLHSEFDQSWVFVMVVCICASVGCLFKRSEEPLPDVDINVVQNKDCVLVRGRP